MLSIKKACYYVRAEEGEWYRANRLCEFQRALKSKVDVPGKKRSGKGKSVLSRRLTWRAEIRPGIDDLLLRNRHELRIQFSADNRPFITKCYISDICREF